MSGAADVQAPVRVQLPGGGSILAPKGYATDFSRSKRASSAVIFRRMRNNLGGYAQCDGLINIARRDQFADLDAFAVATEDVATNEWLYGNLKPGWTSFESERFPVSYADTPSGRSRSQELSLNTPGFFRARVNKGWRIAFDHPAGLLVQVWLFDRDGGHAGAAKLAGVIAESFTKT